MFTSISFSITKIFNILGWIYNIPIPWKENSNITLGPFLLALLIISIIINAYRLMIFGSTAYEKSDRSINTYRKIFKRKE